MVVTVGSGPQAISLARAGIIIYGIRYRTTPFLESDLDSICASCYKLEHHTHLCDPEQNPPRCKFCPLPHPTNKHKCLISSCNKQGACEHHTKYCAICGVSEDHDTGYNGCPAIVEAKTKAKERKTTAYNARMAKRALPNTSLTDDMVH
jgi:hypothetical protein